MPPDAPAFTVMRAFRLLRVFRLLRSWTSLQRLLAALLDSLNQLFYLMLLILLCPFDIFYRAFRFEMVVATVYTVFAPFCPVRFKDFFLGDVLTSMTKPLVDACFLTCFLVQVETLDDGTASRPQWYTH